MTSQKSSLDKIRGIIESSIAAKKALLDGQLANIDAAARLISGAIAKGGKLIIFGNGGSAADSQHIAAELVGRFQRERKALPAIALTTHTSSLTAIANDYGYDVTFSRQIEALAKKPDVGLAISTSGNAKNVLQGARLAKDMDLSVIGLSGGGGGELSKLASINIIVPSKVTARIQESHIMIGHIICELVESVICN